MKTEGIFSLPERVQKSYREILIDGFPLFCLKKYIIYKCYSTYIEADEELAGRIANVSISMPTN